MDTGTGHAGKSMHAYEDKGSVSIGPGGQGKTLKEVKMAAFPTPQKEVHLPPTLIVNVVLYTLQSEPPTRTALGS